MSYWLTRLFARSAPVGLAALAFVFAPQLSANTILLSNSGCSKGCTTPPYATVDYIPDADGKSLDFSITLGSDGSPYHFHRATDANHFAFTFSLLGSPAVNIVGLPSGFEVAGTEPGSYTPSPFGTFSYAIRCDVSPACGAGYSGGPPGPLQFTVTPVTGVLTTSTIIRNSAGFLFTVDIVDALGNSGNVADPGAPEPSTMLLSAAVLVGFILRQHFRRSAHPSA